MLENIDSAARKGVFARIPKTGASNMKNTISRQTATTIVIHTPGTPDERWGIDAKTMDGARTAARALGETLEQFVKTAILERLAELRKTEASTVKPPVITPHEGWVQVTPAIRRLAKQLEVTPEALAQDILLSGSVALDNSLALNEDIELNPILFACTPLEPSFSHRWTITAALDTLPPEFIQDCQRQADYADLTIQAVLFREMLHGLPSE
jgi:hypothetical protein